MAISVNRGARVLLDKKETFEQVHPTTYSYITLNGDTSIESQRTKIFSIFWEADSGTITLHNAPGATAAFMSFGASLGGFFKFGPRGLNLSGGLSASLSGGTTPNVTIVHSPF